MKGLPAGWTSAPLCEIAPEVKTSSIQPLPGVTYELWSVPSFADRAPENIDGGAIGSSKRPVAPDDVLVCKINPRINRVWKVGALRAHEQIASPEWIAVRPKATGRVDPDYLRLYLSGPAFRSWISGEVSGVTGSHTRAKPGQVMAQEIPLPPHGEQHRIVDLLENHLSRLDAADIYLAASRRRLVALERSALDAHFGGRDVPLADLVVDISAGKSFGAANAPAREDEWGIIKVSAMTWGEFNPSENKAVTATKRVDPRFEICEGDLLVSRANTAEYVGASVLVGHVRPKLLLSDKSLRVTPRPDVETEWLWRALQAPSARRQISTLATGTKDSMRNISQAALKQVLIPKVRQDDQAVALKAVGEVAAAITLLRREIEAGEQRLRALRRSLLTAAFAGRPTATGAAPDLSVAEEMIGA